MPLHLCIFLYMLTPCYAAPHCAMLCHVMLCCALLLLLQLRDQEERLAELVDGMVQGYHSGFARSIQNYSQILHLFGEAKDQVGSSLWHQHSGFARSIQYYSQAFAPVLRREGPGGECRHSIMVRTRGNSTESLAWYRAVCHACLVCDVEELLHSYSPTTGHLSLSPLPAGSGAEQCTPELFTTNHVAV